MDVDMKSILPVLMAALGYPDVYLIACIRVRDDEYVAAIGDGLSFRALATECIDRIADVRFGQEGGD